MPRVVLSLIVIVFLCLSDVLLLVSADEVDSDSSSNDEAQDQTSTSEPNDEAEEEEIAIPSKFRVTKRDGVMYEIVGDNIRHDKFHFTQGLTYSRKSGRLFESNGLFAHSSLCELDPETGDSMRCLAMNRNVFAEGLQVYGRDKDDEKLIQLTWKNGVGYIYNASTFEKIYEFKFSTERNEGWGICYDESKHEFIVSDGSEFLFFWDADTLEEKRRVSVQRHHKVAARNINELEFVNGRVLANVWYEDVILVINPETGECESEYDMSKLWPQNERPRGTDVFNGISVSQDDGVLYVTGKKWDRTYKLQLKGF